MSNLSEQAQNLLQLIPESGSIGNVTARAKLSLKFAEFRAAGTTTAEEYNYAAAKSELLAAHLISLGRGKGGSVKRKVVPAFAENYARSESGQTETTAVATEEF